MKRILIIGFVLLFSLDAQSQVIEQKGITYCYKGKNPREPIGGVYIKASASDNGEVSAENSGAFTLVFKNLKMGDLIGSVQVTKQGMMVFNQQAVDEWSVRKEPLCLILCDADEFQKQKDNLIEIGRNEAKKKYDRQLAELKELNVEQKLKIDVYYSKLDSLEKEYRNALKHMDEYADVFARIDESEVDPVAQQAIELFNRGEIEESMRLLEQQNYMEKIKQANRTIEQADKMISTAERAKELAEQDKKQSIEGVYTQIAAYKLQNEWEKAKTLLKELADNLNTLETIYDYASFCYNQNDFDESEVYYLKYNELISNDNSLDDKRKSELLSIGYNGLGALYSDTKRYLESEAMYKSAMVIRERITKTNPSKYEPALAEIQYNLGNLYWKTQRYSESEAMYKFSMEIRERLAKTNPSVYEPALAVTQNGLANLYCDTQRFFDGELMYRSAIEILDRLAKTNPSVYEFDLTMIQNNLGVLYSETQRYSESEAMYKSAIEILDRLAKTNPSAYEPALAETQNNLGVLYSETQRFAESEAMYRSAMEIRERFAKSNPSAYEPELAMTQNNLGLLYSDTQRYSESEARFKAVIGIYERLAKTYPSAYEPELAKAQNNLGLLYGVTQRYSESEAMYKSAIGIYEHLVKTNPSIYEPELAAAQNNLGNLYSETQRYSESEAMYRSAMEIRERLAKTNPLAYESVLAKTQNNLGILYCDTQRYFESEVIYQECVKNYSHLYEKNPQMYALELAKTLFNLGFSRVRIDKIHDAIAPFSEALTLARSMVKAGEYYIWYFWTLYYLADISQNERDYASAYNYNDEAVSHLKVLYYEDSQKWEDLYFQHLVSQSFYSNLLGKFEEGEQYSLEALKIDSTQSIVYTNLAAALLMQGKIDEAEKIYRQYKSEFKYGMLEDLAEYERLGVIPKARKKDVERIKAILSEE